MTPKPYEMSSSETSSDETSAGATGPIEMTAGEASRILGLKLVGDSALVVRGVADPAVAKSDQVCFIEAHKYLPAFLTSSSRCWIITAPLFESLDDEVKKTRVFLVSERAYLSFVKLVDLFFPAVKPRAGRSPLAEIHPTAEVHDSAQIDAFVTVGAHAKVGAGCILHGGVWIGEGSTVGASSVLYGGVKIYPRCIIGARNILHAGCVIGSDGFGFLPTPHGMMKIPQVGRAILHDDVEVGANATIDRGTLDDTVIGQGSKIDNLVQIGHNCKLGKNTVLCAFVGLSGNTTLGDNVLMAGQSATKGHLKIGDNVQVGGQSGVSKDLPAGAKVKGYPAQALADFMRIQVLIQKLPDIYGRLVNLEKHAPKRGDIRED